MNDRITIREFLKNYKNGLYNDNDVKTQIEAGWHDWFCRDEKLRDKTIRLTKRLISIIKTNRFSIDRTFVFFKNNQPLHGRCYDTFSICDIQGEGTLYCIVPKDGHTGERQGRAEVWGKANKFECPLVAGTWDDVKAFFLGTANSC